MNIDTLNEKLFELKEPYLKTITCLDKGFVKLVDFNGSDQRIVQAARVSYGQGTKTVREDQGLIDYLIRHAHTSPLEMVNFTFHVKLPIFVARQLIRHRTACLAGDVCLWFDEPAAIKKGTRKRRSMTIGDFYHKWHNGSCSKFNPKRKNGFVEKINPQKYYTVPEIAKITKRAPESLRTWLQKGNLKGLKIISTKKTDCTWQILGQDWIDFSQREISWNNNLKNILSNMNLRMCNEDTGEILHTHIKDIWSNGIKDVFEVELENGYSIKMTKDHLCFTENGWGTLENLVDLNLSDELNCSWSADSPLFCINGAIAYQDYNWMKEKRDQGLDVQSIADLAGCSYHTIRKWLKIHNLELTFLQYFNDHRYFDFFKQESKEKMAYKTNQKKLIKGFSKIKNIKYIGKEEVYDIEVEGPFHNFVANGFIVHNSVNEISGRYSVLKDEFYIPEVSRIQKQSKDNKQGSSDEIVEGACNIPIFMHEEQTTVYQNYQKFLNMGVAKELARIDLPVSTYTEWFWNIDLHNLFHFLKLRLDSHAQHEIRVFAQAKYDLIKPIVPYACESFEKHIVNGRKFSGDEMDVIKNVFTSEMAESITKELGWKKSKVEEFIKKL
jgi:thymidylate synthase ThyX